MIAKVSQLTFANNSITLCYGMQQVITDLGEDITVFVDPWRVQLGMPTYCNLMLIHSRHFSGFDLGFGKGKKAYFFILP